MSHSTSPTPATAKAPATATAAAAAPRRIAIIKADDMWARDPQWEPFLQESAKRGVKVSIGVLCNSLEGDSAEKQAYYAWLRELEASGQVELWHHGWDHKRWEENGKTLSEYSGTGYAHQLDHTARAQQAAKDKLGITFNALGTPFNAMDADSVRVFNEMPELEMVFIYADNPFAPGLSDKLLLPMNIGGEHDGTGKPNAEKFRADYNARTTPLHFAAIQVHPPHFKEGSLEQYTEILDFLLADGWEFLLPREYQQTLRQSQRQH